MTKIDKRKKYMLVLDVETANMVDDAICYDIGFAVSDKKGNLYEKYSFMVAEMFMDKQNRRMLKGAYYANKIPQYWLDSKAGKRKIASIYTIRKVLREVMERWNIKEVYAYNAHFDLHALNRTIRYLTQSRTRYFFPYGTEIYCIWHMATQVICRQRNYFKFADKYDYVSDAGNLQTSAEKVCSYIDLNPAFVESHTGLEDVEIEARIMAKCFAQHKSMNKEINRMCWKIPQPDFQTWKAE